MKIIFLAPGLNSAKRGYERFVLELAAELRKAGLDAICWGTSTAEGVEEIPMPGRAELQAAVLERFRSNPRFAAIPGMALQDWSIYTEDQLFSIPAAVRAKELLDQNESVLVYAKWQGGLVDPSGAPTELLKVMAAGHAAGRAKLLVHTDYVYAPIDSLVRSAGAAFHAVGPWITEQLLSLAVPQSSIIELPMSITAAAYQNCRDCRREARTEWGIPEEAFVILSVGSFDATTPDKRHSHTLREICSLPEFENIWWVVAGSRGPAETVWEQEARHQMGVRFVPLRNVPFGKMPQLYGLSDLFMLASLSETFGLSYLEAQFAGLPVVIHDSKVSRHLCAGLSPVQLAISLVDMQRPGSAGSAIERWRQLFEDERREAIREALTGFSQAQVKRFAWECTGPRFAEAFSKLCEPSSVRPQFVGVASSQRPDSGTWDEQSHRQAIQLFERGKYQEAAVLLGRVIGGRETGERWNDWATVQVALTNSLEAEQGFRLALALDPRHAQAAANLGAVLVRMGRKADAIPFLERALESIDSAQRTAVLQLLDECRAERKLHPAPVSKQDLEQFLRGIGDPAEQDELHDEATSYCLAVLNVLPDGVAGERVLCVGRMARYLAPALARFKGFSPVNWCPGAGDVKTAGPEKLENPSFEIGERWPYDDASFDYVLAAQALEHLTEDPMHLFCEANRVLKRDGRLFLTAANIASTKSVHSVLEGRSPYVRAQFPAGLASPFDRRGREYTTEDIELLAKSGGFAIDQTRTHHIFWEPIDKIYAALAASGYPIGTRGDTISLLATKNRPVRERYPAKLYELSALSEEAVRDSPGEPTTEPPSRVVDRPLRILVIHENALRPDRGGGDHRLLQVMRLLRAQGHSVTYLAPRGFEKEKHASVLAGLGIEVFADDAQVLRREGIDVVPRWTLQQLLREGQFDLAIILLWFWMCVSLPEHYLDEIRRLSPRTRIAILTDDCHGLRETRGANLSGLFSDHERAADYQEREAEILRRADFAMAISQLDCERFRESLPGIDIEWLPMMVAPGTTGKSFDERDGLMYLADYTNPASRDGIEWYLKHVAPIVNKDLPGTKLYLVGTGLPSDLGAGDESIVQVGFAPDLSTELAARRILISPVRYGTGIKTKNLHAMSHGLPIVTTTIGSEGMGLAHGNTALIADTADDFARAVIRLHGDRALWHNISEQGRAHILKQFSEDHLASQLQVIAKKVRAARPKGYEAAHEWSVRRVEKYFPEVTTHHPSRERPALRVLAYIRSAEQLLSTGDRAEARRQLRHVFSFVPSRVSHQQFFNGFTGMVENMERTYRALGESNAANEFRRETRIYVPWAFPELPVSGCGPKASTQRNRKSRLDSRLDFSVLIPTFNRRQTLSQCLEALHRQSFSPNRFEVIVVDDGSTDGTPESCENYKPRHHFRYLRQDNAGAGAARRLGVEEARGGFALLFNDDTIADPDLLERHWRAHREHAKDKVAVLGDFRYPDTARKRALTYFLSVEPFLFPQVTLEAGLHSKNAYFVASNLSLRRDAVLDVGSFDPRFRIAEDTELGVRLRQRGFSVVYVPEARAIHQHIDFTIRDLIRRAEIYGRTQVMLFEKHPQLLGDGAGPFGKLDQQAIQKIRAHLDQHGLQVRAAAESLEKFDSVDFLPFFSKMTGNGNAAHNVMDLFKRALPIVFWYYLFAGFLAEWGHRSKVEAVSGRETVSERI